MGSILPAVFVMILLGGLSLAASGTLPTSVSGASSPSPAGLTPSTPLDCNKVTDPTPSALYIPLNEPKTNLSSGGRITTTMEFSVVNFTNASLGVSVYLPTVYFTFPLAPTGTFSVTLSPQTRTIAGPGWTNGTGTTRSTTPAGGLHFPTGGKTRLTTQRVAIQANVPYGQLTLEFRWMWSLTQPNGTVTQSPWTLPQSTYTKGSTILPSIFFPAQYIKFLSGPGNGQSVTIGTNYTAQLGGPVAGKYFFLEMENGAGSVVMSYGQTAAANATIATVIIPVLNYDHYLTPGLYLVHIHDACGAVLYNKLIKAVFAPIVTVTFYLQPGSCGPMTFNGTSFANGTSGRFVPSVTPYTFTVPGCKGYSFSNWFSTGGLHLSSSDHLLVSYNGTFTIQYKKN